jgi:hypothetical protein
MDSDLTIICWLYQCCQFFESPRILLCSIFTNSLQVEKL